MGWKEETKNDAVDAITARGDWIALYAGDPYSAGTRVTAAGSEQTVWPAADDGLAVGTQCVFDTTPGAVHVTHYGCFDDDPDTSGVLQFGFPLDPGFTLDAEGPAYITPRVNFPG